MPQGHAKKNREDVAVLYATQEITPGAYLLRTIKFIDALSRRTAKTTILQPTTVTFNGHEWCYEGTCIQETHVAIDLGLPDFRFLLQPGITSLMKPGCVLATRQISQNRVNAFVHNSTHLSHPVIIRTFGIETVYRVIGNQHHGPALAVVVNAALPTSQVSVGRIIGVQTGSIQIDRTFIAVFCTFVRWPSQ
ncbi:MAG: hypothetical protein BWY72_02188 [Bacteroidetes bacterium ADurb.Bin416]|nr:MAG: hypothetical protein BWY72_02188 [Bacteroidetes bacterium ADurb.Bin416]